MVVKTFYQVVELAFSWFLLNVFHVANHVGMAPGSFDPRDGRVRAMTFWFDEATLTAEPFVGEVCAPVLGSCHKAWQGATQKKRKKNAGSHGARDFSRGGLFVSAWPGPAGYGGG